MATATSVQDIKDNRAEVERNAEPYTDDAEDELARLKREKAELEAALVEARKPRNGLGVEDRRRLGSVALMGSDRFVPVALMRDTEIEHQAFIDKCDRLTLAPKVRVLEPGVEPPPLQAWPNAPSVSADVPGRLGDPTRRVEVDPESEAW